MSIRFVAGVGSLALMLAGPFDATAQDYPNKPIRVVTSGVGGGGDFIARLAAQGITGPLGQPVIVDNRGIGRIQGEVVSQASPDGYTLLVSSTGFITGALLERVPYDVVRDFAPITQLEGSPNVLAIYAPLPAKSVKELIALAKAKPGALNYGMSGLGGTSQLAAELFNSMAGVHIIGVNYKGAGQSIASLIAGEIQLRFGAGPAVMPHVGAGRLRVLAVTSAQPSALFPGLPTIAASGLPGYEAIGLTAVFAPAKTPGTVIKRLNQELVRAFKTPEAKEKLFNAGIDTETALGTPEQLAATVKSEMAKWAKVIKDAGIRGESSGG